MTCVLEDAQGSVCEPGAIAMVHLCVQHQACACLKGLNLPGRVRTSVCSWSRLSSQYHCHLAAVCKLSHSGVHRPSLLN